MTTPYINFLKHFSQQANPLLKEQPLTQHTKPSPQCSKLLTTPLQPPAASTSQIPIHKIHPEAILHLAIARNTKTTKKNLENYKVELLPFGGFWSLDEYLKDQNS